MRRIETSVLIVGGGGSGLCAASFLADLGVDTVLVERHPGTSHLPKAHYLNQRTMEVLRHHGMADAVYAHAAPRETIGQILWRTPLGGDQALDRMILKAIDAMGGGGFTDTYDRHGVTPPAHLAQIHLEPILRGIAEDRNPGRVLFSHALLDFVQDDPGVVARVRDLHTDEEISVHARYLLAADAGKTVGPAIGVKMIADARVQTRVSVYFSADLSGYITEDTAAMHCIVNPNGIKAGDQLFSYLVAYGPRRWGRHSETWGMGLAFGPDEAVLVDEENLARRIRAFLQVDVPITVLGYSQWFQEAMIANRFVEGRVIQIGDAVHKHPPAGGLGLNSAIQDAHNVCWKLAAILSGVATERLLASYETERRPVVERNAQHATLMMSNFAILAGALGVAPTMSPAYNRAQLAALLADTADGRARRARMDHVFALTRAETGAHDLDLGFTYESGALVPDESAPPLRDATGVRYTPSARPGSRLPHCWLSRGGEPVSTHDLIPMGGFLLLTGPDGLAWCSAAGRVAGDMGIVIRTQRVDRGDEAVRQWLATCGLEDSGAALVRPDGHVAFRSVSVTDDPYRELTSAVRCVLGWN